MTLIYLLLTQFLWAQTPQYRVHLDLTRTIKKGCVYQDEKQVHCFKLSGGRNKSETYKSARGGRVRYCSYTSTGENLMPQTVMRVRQSKEFRAGLEYFVGFDEARGIGTHTGDISGYSGGCIRLQKKDAKYLYDLVKENSVMQGQLVVSSNVSYTVVDNTPERPEKECDCANNYLNFLTIHKERAEQICNEEPYAIELPEYLKPKAPEIIRPRPRPAHLQTPVELEFSPQ